MKNLSNRIWKEKGDEMEEKLCEGKEEIVKAIWQAKAVELRDVPPKITNAEAKKLPLNHPKRPHLYASGNWGPGYIFIKGLVSSPGLFNRMVCNVAEKLTSAGTRFDFVTGLMTGGVTPGYRLSQIFEVPFVYLEGTRRQETISARVIVRDKLEEECEDIVNDIVEEKFDPVFIAGAAPRGMIPGFRVAQLLSEKLGRDIPFAYIRPQRKKGGLGELVTRVGINRGSSAILITNKDKREFATEALDEDGFKALAIYDIDENQIEASLDDTTLIPEKGRGVVVEELVNFAGSTGNGALWLRDKGYTVKDSATILTYENPEAIERLRKMEVRHHYFITLTELLDIGEKHECAEPRLVQEYRRFLKNPLKWQAERGLTPIERGGTV